MTTSAKVLVVCLGNHCRSPYAEAVLRDLLGDSAEVRSAGIRHKHASRPAHPLMVEVAADRGHDLTCHRGQQVTTGLLEWADLVLAMDQANFDALHAIAPPGTHDRLRLFDTGDVPDPWGGVRADFEACADVIDAAARHLTL